MTDPTKIPGWKWMPGMAYRSPYQNGWMSSETRAAAANKLKDDTWKPVINDPATEGCLLRLLGRKGRARIWWDDTITSTGQWCVDDLGAACVALADALGRWPGGSDE